MALAFPLLAGLLIAPLLGGRWSRLAELQIRWVGLFYAAIVLQIVAFPVSSLPWRTPDRAAVVLWLTSYGLFAVAAARNARIAGVPLIALGMASNVAAILSNGGHMPALPSALRAAGLHFEQSRNSTALAAPHLHWLVDRWAAPAWVPWANVYSIGDVLIALGGFILALGATGALRRPRISVLPREDAPSRPVG
jgi:Family of unknown function (DUF5317)